MRIKALGILTAVLVTLSSCWKEDERFVLQPAGNVTQKQVKMGESYDKIIYFNIHTQDFMVRSLADWDFAFENTESGLHIRMNGGKGFRAHETSETDFAVGYTVVSGHEFKYDAPNGHLDSTGIGTWWSNTDGTSKSKLYIINTDPTKTSGTAHFKRFQVQKADKTGFWVKVGNLDGNIDAKTYFIPKDAKYNYSYLNIATGEVKTDLEPEKDTWDIVFTRYQHVYHDQGPEPLPYQVTGVLLNPNGVKAYEETKMKFEDITLDYALGLNYTADADVIGFDWKYYNQTSGRFTVNPNLIYIVKTVSGYYYKLRFIDFYDEKGIKGNPLFDLQRL
ncbi:MAG: HmuY family protein [Bacteroidota bacterium]